MAEVSAWTSKSIGSRFGHWFFYMMVRIGGRRLAYFFLYFIVLYYVLFHPAVSLRTDPYLLRRFPGSNRLKRVANRYLLTLSLGKALIDRAVFGILGSRAIQMKFEEPADFEELKALAGQSGFILLMSHVGCWQAVMSALPDLGRRVNLLMLRDQQDIDKHYFEHGEKTASPFNIINPEQFLGGGLEMLSALKNDEILCIMGDRIFKPEEPSLELNFLGSKANFPTSAYRMASLAQKPIVVLNSRKSGPSGYTLAIPDVMSVPGKLGRKKDAYRPYVKRFVDSLESYADRDPFQFFNFYDMWMDHRL